MPGIKGIQGICVVRYVSQNISMWCVTQGISVAWYTSQNIDDCCVDDCCVDCCVRQDISVAGMLVRVLVLPGM